MAERATADPFEELRVGFTAAVSHELRTPLARLLALLDSASLPSSDTQALIEGTGTACVCALLVEPLVGGVRGSPEQQHKARHQEYEYRSHESHSRFPES